MNQTWIAAARTVAAAAELLRERRLDWPTWVQEAARALVFHAGPRPPVAIIALVGGASAGKSTVFNNLLDGRLASAIAARGHTTLGMILAAHESHREAVESALRSEVLFPGVRRNPIELDDDHAGQPDAVGLVFHGVERLRDALLIDTPDFTSAASEREGDQTLAHLAWFDAVVLVIDHERWFDRQADTALRSSSVAFGQRRFVLFNRTNEGELAAQDRAVLEEQARRLRADDWQVLEFRRGRGFRRFPPGTLEALMDFLAQPAPQRIGALRRVLQQRAGQVLGQNDERRARFEALRSSLDSRASGMIPTAASCMTALMVPSERQHLDLIARVLRLRAGVDWFREQRQRLRRALGQLPMLGAILPPASAGGAGEPASPVPRLALAEGFFDASVRRVVHHLERSVRSSAFWDELHAWVKLDPPPITFSPGEDDRRRLRENVDHFEGSLAAWVRKVTQECQGFAPHMRGGFAATAVALAVVLIAVPGPLSALTLASAKGALVGAMGQLLGATGAGLFLGKPLGRLAHAIQEKLLGSAEFDQLRAAANEFSLHLDDVRLRLADGALRQAAAYLIPRDDPLHAALEALAGAMELEA